MIEREIPFKVKVRTMKILNNLRTQPLKDPQTQRMREQMYENAPLIPSQIKDIIALLYMTKILGAKEGTASKFTNGDRNAWLKIGSLHESGSEKNLDIKGFWNGVNNLVPGFFSSADLKHQIKVDEKGKHAWGLVCAFDSVGSFYSETSSRVIRKLLVNADCHR